MNKIFTKYGTCIEDKDGYWIVSSRKEGNKNKRLHRLVWEEYNSLIPHGFVIHHKDNNRKNNSIARILNITASIQFYFVN